MPTLVYLLFAYGITFGIQNKAPFLRGKIDFLDALVKCTYCVGFHAGWLAWITYWLLENPNLGVGWAATTGNVVLSVLIWGLSSAAFSYGIDTAIRWFEYRAK